MKVNLRTHGVSQNNVYILKSYVTLIAICELSVIVQICSPAEQGAPDNAVLGNAPRHGASSHSQTIPVFTSHIGF